MMATVTGMGRRMARWVAGLAAAACCMAGVALPAHAVDEEPISLPQTAPSQAPSPGFLPGHILKISARLDRTTYETGDDEIEWVTHYYVFVRKGPYGAEITRDDCQQIANTFWAGSADTYTASAVYDLSGCSFDAYYLKDAQHAFYSLDESGHIEVRAPSQTSANSPRHSKTPLSPTSKSPSRIFATLNATGTPREPTSTEKSRPTPIHPHARGAHSTARLSPPRTTPSWSVT